jgi:hypothetical protein
MADLAVYACDAQLRALLYSCELIEDPPGTTILVFKSRLLADKLLQLVPEAELRDLVRRARGEQAAQEVRVAVIDSLAERLFGKAVAK